LGYKVYRGTSSEDLEFYDTIPVQNSYVDSDVVLGTRYYYAMSALNNLGEGQMTEIYTIVATSPPGEPSDLIVMGKPGEIELTWSPPVQDGGSQILGFRIYKGESVLEMSLLTTTLPGTTSYADWDVTNGTETFYSVSVFTVVGEGPRTTNKMAVALGPPGPPLGVILEPGDGQVLVTWNPPLNEGGKEITGYALYSGPSQDEMVYSVTVGAVNSGYIADIENGKTVHIIVAAINEMGEGEPSSPIHTVPYGVQSAPRDFGAHAIINGVHLTWEEPLDIGGADSIEYQVLRGTNSQVLTPLVSVKDSFEFLDTTVLTRTTYFYQVVPLNPIGLVGQGTEVVEVLFPALPGQVTRCQAMARDGVVSLSWGSPEDDGGAPILHYVIWRAVEGGDPLELTRVENGTEYSDMTVVNGQFYTYSIAAVNLRGPGPYSEPLPASPLNPPGSPWDLSADVDGGKVVLKWAAPIGSGAPVTGYTILRGTDRDDMKIVAEGVDGTKYTDDEVDTGITYYYRVVAESEMGDSEPSQELEVATEYKGLFLIALAAVVIGIIAVVMYRRSGRR
jgi:fibronectin type 3 domain-containing protein